MAEHAALTWASLIKRVDEQGQVAGLPRTLNDHWEINSLTDNEQGARVDLAVVAAFTSATGLNVRPRAVVEMTKPHAEGRHDGRRPD
jgi:hypothetical protein